MREIIYQDEDGRPLCPVGIDDCMLDNLDAPVIRSGGEPFRSYYAVECCYYCYSAIDPSRSFVDTIVKAMDERCAESNNWPASDAIHVLLRDIGIDYCNLTRADMVAFWTIFPKGLSAFLSLPYMRLTSFNKPHGDVVRVLNNPFFYRDANASQKRLVEIADVDGFRFALDRASFIAPPAVLAKELSLLNYGCSEPARVSAFAEELTGSISETMSCWGLEPEHREEG